MIRTLKFLKPYAGFILIVIFLLFIQANADLALPDYLSKIVNIGIQQGGVENPIPAIIRQSRMNQVGAIMNETDFTRILSSYTILTPPSDNYPVKVQNLDFTISEPVYLLKDIDVNEICLLYTSPSPRDS